MKIKKRIKVLAIGALAVAVSFVSFGGNFAAPMAAHAAVSDWQKGANISPNSNTDFGSGSFQQSLANLAGTGANYVTLDVPIYQSNVWSTDVQNGWNTPTDSSLAAGISQAHSLGLHVMLKFNLFPNDGQWSAYINPSDRDSWFRNYQNVVMHFAQIAQANGVEELAIGTELIDMASDSVNSTNTAHWFALINTIRGSFSGKLTYDSNWGDSGFPDEKDQIQFWSALDYIGISAYFNLSGDGSVASLMASWDGWNNSGVAPLASKWNKQVLFTEIGYRSIFDSYQHPWMWWEGGGADPGQQARDYQALFQYWNQVPFMAGVQLWNWSSNPNAGGSGDNEYTPQNKSAQDVMKQWFGTSTPPPPPPPQGNPKFNASATVTPASPAPGQSAAFSVTATDSGDAVSNTNVDIEIYNSAGSQVLQKISSGQNFTPNASQNYPATWTAGNADSYTLKVGIFSGDWSKNYYWGNSVLAFTVGSGNPPPPPPPPPQASSTINVWWPTNGSTIDGVQPFKAMVTNMSVDSYSMFWQVDGGQLNSMASNQTDYPHKEADVNVDPWTWRGNGPYVINFVAQNPGGQTIAQSSVSISK